MNRILILFVGLALGATGASASRSHWPPEHSRPERALKDQLFYQIFTRSMRDSNNDREGDLKGIEESLPYLQKLGVTSILLTPIQPSPFYHNYFPNRASGIDPAFGTMADFRHLARAVHERGMKIYLDEEFQYVTYDHPWFRSALHNPSSPFSHFFFFRGPENTRPEPGPFGITIAHRFPGEETGITTINMAAPAFRAWATNNLMEFVDPSGTGNFSDGVDGFRIDHMMDDLDNKHIDPNLFATFWRPLFAKLKARNPRLVIIAEQWDWGFGGEFLRRGGADAVFAFPLSDAIRSFDKDKITSAIKKTNAATPAGKTQLTFLENHDTQRIASDDNMTPEKLRTAGTLSVMLEGTPLIYYGQELGMRGKPRSEYQSDERDIGDREAFRWNSATPSPGEADWYEGSKSYWTKRFAKSHDGISVAEEDKDSKSLLNHYRRLFAVRKANPALRDGSQQILASPPNILAIERSAKGETIAIIANLSPEIETYKIRGRDLLNGRSANGQIELKPFETRLIRVVR